MSNPKSAAAVALANVARAQVSPAAVPARRKKIALGVAMVADAVQMGLFPAFIEGAVSPYDDALDLVISALLVLILGFRWRLVLSFAAELVPGLALAPSWTLVVASLPVIPNDAADTTTAQAITVTPVHPELPEHSSK